LTGAGIRRHVHFGNHATEASSASSPCSTASLCLPGNDQPRNCRCRLLVCRPRWTDFATELLDAGLQASRRHAQGVRRISRYRPRGNPLDREPESIRYRRDRIPKVITVSCMNQRVRRKDGSQWEALAPTRLEQPDTNDLLAHGPKSADDRLDLLSGHTLCLGPIRGQPLGGRFHCQTLDGMKWLPRLRLTRFSHLDALAGSHVGHAFNHTESHHGCPA
jgi:hypothetical protein